MKVKMTKEMQIYCIIGKIIVNTAMMLGVCGFWLFILYYAFFG